MSCSCSGSGFLNSAGSTLFGWMYSLQGAPDPFSQDDAACQAAQAQLKAQGLDPCDPANADALQAAHDQALQQNAAVIQSTPVSNSLQLEADILAGTATSSTPVTQPTPSSGPNYLLLIGFLAILALGFYLVIR